MVIYETPLIRVKKTKSVRLYYDPLDKVFILHISQEGARIGVDTVHIPLMKAPQVLRGLFSGIQRFWRRKL